ncbi:MAG: hypothetical protein ACRC1Z_08310 [Waterburya sp.]
MNHIHSVLPPADLDDIFHYKLSPHRQIDDHCRIRIYRRATKIICIMTELKNSGMSVTNCVEKIIPQIFWLFEQENNPLPKNTIFIEHYDPDSYNLEHTTEDFSVVTINNAKPCWQSISPAKILELLT